MHYVVTLNHNVAFDGSTNCQSRYTTRQLSLSAQLHFAGMLGNPPAYMWLRYIPSIPIPPPIPDSPP
ncbi:hypothetical protein ASPCADRAFT_212305 [Aspergillus carbonarius ITEM 5010]|uniref:Uncharacterized protein n=1 Tax=Aspergillus carbonarius (strain ITEM 5010) TaxID=602072 RepID=A0A1R3R6B3_ASPC5|nr:hypothetical protein ASPCADRAFT_212305 [Aspergillus carbonarius ITEM 5010]